MGEGILAHIGRTPLVRLGRLTESLVFAKAEFLNPGGSIKDRVAARVVTVLPDRAERYFSTALI